MDLGNDVILTKEVFLNCTGAKDTVWPNGDHLKYIPNNQESYTIEVKINGALDTLDLYLSCKTNSGMIPNVLFRSDSGCVGLGQGSSSYRYLTLCSINSEARRISIDNFETGINVSSETDGFFFKKDTCLFFYDLLREKLFCKRIPMNTRGCTIKEFTLLKNSVRAICEDGNFLIYSLNEFSLNDSNLCLP